MSKITLYLILRDLTNVACGVCIASVIFKHANWWSISFILTILLFATMDRLSHNKNIDFVNKND